MLRKNETLWSLNFTYIITKPSEQLTISLLIDLPVMQRIRCFLLDHKRARVDRPTLKRKNSILNNNFIRACHTKKTGAK